MDTNARRRRAHKVVTNTTNELYCHDVNMYRDPPQNDITLSEFEDLCFERLQLLRIVEQATLKGHKMFSDNWKQSIKEDLAKNNLKKYIRLMSGLNNQNEADIQARRADHISHFILRLAYCRSEDLRRWFLTREMELFKLRFLAQNQQGVMKFLQLNNFTYTPITNEEKEDIKNELITSTPGISDVACDATDFYKVHFTEVAPLVKNRRVYLKRGYAYIPTSDLVVCIQAKFRALLNEALNIYNHHVPSIDDERLDFLFTNLHNAYTGRDYSAQDSANKEAINPAHLDEYSKKHYPLCMSHIHGVLKSTHHLKHFCRLQYGLFLKGIGVLYEQAMEFWRQEFTKAIDSNQFDKQYSYGFRHQYGKVGSMTNYSPYSCMKIITSSVGPTEQHGCPFRHWDAATLKQKVVEYGVSAEGVHSIMDLVKNGHYQIACTKYFECTHGQPPTNVINHPNQYFEESMNLAKEKQNKK